jgi:hypothetical protein
MLKHTVEGPFSNGEYGVVYQTPGCTVKTAVSMGCNREQAVAEALRLNNEQLAREKRLSAELRLCGMHYRGD